jgi:hypothetical protein
VAVAVEETHLLLATVVLEADLVKVILLQVQELLVKVMGVVLETRLVFILAVVVVAPAKQDLMVLMV